MRNTRKGGAGEGVLRKARGGEKWEGKDGGGFTRNYANGTNGEGRGGAGFHDAGGGRSGSGRGGAGGQQVRGRAYAEHPGRFVKGLPKAESVPQETWVNKPADLSSDGKECVSWALGASGCGIPVASRFATPCLGLPSQYTSITLPPTNDAAMYLAR